MFKQKLCAEIKVKEDKKVMVVCDDPMTLGEIYDVGCMIKNEAYRLMEEYQKKEQDNKEVKEDAGQERTEPCEDDVKEQDC